LTGVFLADRRGQQMEGQADRGLGADGRQALEFLDQPLERLGVVHA
jgi:hypothetical protein